MKIEVSSFGGISPVTGARYLSNNQGQIALNVGTWSAALFPIAQLSSSVFALTKPGSITSIYRFGEDLTDPTQHWFHWTNDVDVVSGFIAGDTSERTYYSGDGSPKATDNTLALTGGGTNYPINEYELGVLAPTAAATVAATGVADAGAQTETRVYTYTFVNSWGQESAPAAASTEVTWQTGQGVDVSTATSYSGNYNITNKRIYRSTAGTYLFVAEIPLATAVYNDVVDPDSLNEELGSLTWVEPPATLAGFTELPGGVIAGFDGRDVYFSEPYRPFAWPLQYQQSLSSKVVGMGAIDTTLVVLTQDRPVFIQGSDPSSMIVVDADIHQSCESKRSIVSLNGAVIYASPDGLVALAPGGSRIITEEFFSRSQWQAQVKPSSIHAYTHDNLYIAFFDTGAVQGGFIYDPDSNMFITHDIYVDGGYTDTKNDTLYLTDANTIYTWQGGAAATYTWRSKKFTHPRDVGYTCYRVDAESYPVTFKFIRDGVEIVNTSVTSGDVQRIPAGTGRDYEFELVGTAEVYAVVIAQSPSEL